MSKAENIEQEHPYIANLSKVLLPNFSVINYGKKSRVGFLDIFIYLRKTDIAYLNWIEDFANSKFATLRFSILFIILQILKLFKIRIVWTHHNLHSHKGKTFFNSVLTKLLIKQSTYIIIHTLESQKYIEERYWRKIHYFFHPITCIKDKDYSRNKEYDILIWGSVRKSKGIEEFLKFSANSIYAKSIKIKIVGRIGDPRLREKIMIFKSKNIDIENRYVEDEELPALHAKARFVFFSYTGSSVLNSGVVTKSLPLDAHVLAPNKGSFVDLKNNGLIYTYETFEEALYIVSNYDKYKPLQKGAILDFCEKYSWTNFGNFLSTTLK